MPRKSLAPTSPLPLPFLKRRAVRTGKSWPKYALIAFNRLGGRGMPKASTAMLTLASRGRAGCSDGQTAVARFEFA